MKFFQPSLLLVLGASAVLNADCAGTSSVSTNTTVMATHVVSYAPAVLPGKGLAQHDFLYSGEANEERLSIVRGGQVVWSYIHPGRGEISDAVLQPDGKILFAHQFGITEINLDKKVVWNFDAPANTEIHTARPCGTNSVFFIQNGNPAKFIVMDKTTGHIEHQFSLPAKDTNSVHRQFRRARLTAAGTLLIAHLDLGKIVEYDWNGHALWSYDLTNCWSAEQLANGNILAATSGAQLVREINRQGETVWEWTPADAPEYKFSNTQTATRLPNGNTLINNWFEHLPDGLDSGNAPVQAVEVTPGKKIVWALRSWTPPAELGQATTVQMLDDVYAPAVLPGNGLAQHPFFYAGEWDFRHSNQTMFVVRDGKAAWSYDIPLKNANGHISEFSDATLLSNGNVVFARKTGAGEVTPDKKLIWNYDAPEGTEVHVIQPLGTNRVMFVRNGNPAKLMIVDITTGKTEKELTLPVGNAKKVHGQFRRVRMTKAGTFLAAHIDNNKVAEYDADGKEIWSLAVPAPWAAVRLKNGNTLVTSSKGFVHEVNPKGETVWEFTQKNVPDIKLFSLQEADRLANGNTVLSSWCPNAIKNTNDWPASVQVLEVTPGKKVVWALRSWDEPANLGPATCIQLLDEPGVAENGDLQR